MNTQDRINLIKHNYVLLSTAREDCMAKLRVIDDGLMRLAAEERFLTKQSVKKLNNPQMFYPNQLNKTKPT